MLGFLIHSPVEYYARTTPDHPALSFQGETMSYAELDRRSNQLAHSLMANGAVLQDRVGIFMHKGLDLGVAIYGALKAGCVFVPLDPFLPADRLSFILTDCNIRQVACSARLAGTLAAARKGTTQEIKGQEDPLYVYGVDQTELKEDPPFIAFSWSTVRQAPTHSPDIVMIDQELGYIMYTSGSTGSPKGMMHTHHGSITYARWGAQHVNMQPSDVVASHAPLHFDLSIFDFFSTAQTGATVSLVPEAVARFPASWTALVESERISVVFTVPYTLITMLEQGAMDKRDLSSLRWILFGGEPFPPNKLRALMMKLNDVRFTNVYGPAEAPSCTCYNVPLPAEGDEEPIPIGLVSRNSTDIVIDENDEDCGPGVAGELCIRSSTLTRGYWNRPDLNARAFLMRESFGPFPHVYYRTGDRVVRHADGDLRFLGRIDRMIKTRGHRVELDEVEAVLSSHGAILEAAAYVVPDGMGSQQIMAAVQLDPDEPVETAELFRYARSKLAAYAVPREIIVCPELPHTSTGKINRKQLTEQWQLTNQPGAPTQTAD